MTLVALQRFLVCPNHQFSFPCALERCRELDPAFPEIVFHDLRHTAVTLAFSGGANVKLVQQIAGHSSAVTTLDVCAHLFADDAQSSPPLLAKVPAKAGTFSFPGCRTEPDADRRNRPSGDQPGLPLVLIEARKSAGHLP